MSKPTKFEFYELNWKAKNRNDTNFKSYICTEYYVKDARKAAYAKIRQSQMMARELGKSVKSIRHIEVFGEPWSGYILKVGEAYASPKNPDVILWHAPNNTIHVLNKDGSLKALKKTNIRRDKDRLIAGFILEPDEDGDLVIEL